MNNVKYPVNYFEELFIVTIHPMTLILPVKTVPAR